MDSKFARPLWALLLTDLKHLNLTLYKFRCSSQCIRNCLSYNTMEYRAGGRGTHRNGDIHVLFRLGLVPMNRHATYPFRYFYRIDDPCMRSVRYYYLPIPLGLNEVRSPTAVTELTVPAMRRFLQTTNGRIASSQLITPVVWRAVLNGWNAR